MIGTWHFEERKIDGAFELDGGAINASFIPEGFLGDALCFSGQDSLAEIPVKYDPAFDLTDGFAIDFVVRKDGTGGGRVLRMGDSIGIDIGGAGQVRAWFKYRVEKDGRTQPGGEIRLESFAGAIPQERWTRMRVQYDRTRFQLSIDGVVVDTELVAAPVQKIEDSLVLSDRRRPFPGCVDTLVVSAVTADEPIMLPETVRFVSDVPREIHF
ncbi:MAG: hypothetical protein GY704_01430, partial [Phycisphaeraceae bacterium]|nr:hypothetical protein [Phycisphaeraceae bacterium]